MQTPAPTRAIDLYEPVRSVFAEKATGLWSIPPESTVYEAIALMSDVRVGALVVLNAGRLVGMITERDYMRDVILKGRLSRDTKVCEIMSSPVFYVTPDATIAECMQVMSAQKIRHLPVLEGDEVTGILSIRDVVDWIVATQDFTIRHLQNYITGSYPC